MAGALVVYYGQQKIIFIAHQGHSTNLH